MKTLLLDANNLAMRSLHAMQRSGLSSSGVSTGPLLAFINGMCSHLRDEQPDRVAVCWDGGRSLRRLAVSDIYKAHRATMSDEFQETKSGVFGLAKEFLAASGIQSYEVSGVEADDLIAHFWRNRLRQECYPEEYQTVIVSSDKDFLQLLEPGVEQVRLSSANTPTDRWDTDRVEREYGCQPWALRYALAMAGDVADNVIGAPRVGVKTAVKVLARNDWDFEAALADPKIAEHADRIRENLVLVDLRASYETLALPDEPPLFRPTEPGSAAYMDLLSFLDRYQMESVKHRLMLGGLWR